MSQSFVFENFDFSAAVKDVSAGCLLKPVIHNYLYDAKFPAFDLHFPAQEMERKPDGWFHPSTHPNWSIPALYRYLAFPDTFPVEKKQYMSTLSVTMGKVTHEFMAMCLEDAGVLPKELQVCHDCPPPKKGQSACGEPGFSLPEIGDRGHLDGLLDLSSLGPKVPEGKVKPIFEFKTSNNNFGRLEKMQDLDGVAFRERWPDYWAQQQRYQRMSGRRWSIVLMMEMGYPWLMKEFHIAYDQEFNNQIDRKYLDVQDLVYKSQEAFCCRLKGCPAAELCRV